ncbi:hypothetical protein EBS02_03485 [bacterium]|jgi:hypothetical protein|nr:hypothetical protein [bacterium]
MISLKPLSHGVTYHHQHMLLELIRTRYYIQQDKKFSCVDGQLKVMHKNGYLYPLTQTGWKCSYQHQELVFSYESWNFSYSVNESFFNENSISNAHSVASHFQNLAEHGMNATDWL